MLQIVGRLKHVHAKLSQWPIPLTCCPTPPLKSHKILALDDREAVEQSTSMPEALPDEQSVDRRQGYWREVADAVEEQSSLTPNTTPWKAFPIRFEQRIRPVNDPLAEEMSSPTAIPRKNSSTAKLAIEGGQQG